MDEGGQIHCQYDKVGKRLPTEVNANSRICKGRRSEYESREQDKAPSRLR